jgi:hypothetical protein
MHWRVVVVSIRDRHSLSRALALACAERLTENGCVVLIYTPDSRPLQFAADRVFGISTIDATMPSRAGGACTAHLQVTDTLLAFPLDHPAAKAQPRIDPPLSTTLQIRFQSTAQPAPLAWAKWYAAVGRDMQDHLLQAILTDGLPRVVDERHRPRHDLPERADWQSLLPAPPMIPPAHWLGAIQDEFVRGWIGEIVGATTRDQQGTVVPSIEPFEQALKASRLIKAIAWQEDVRTAAPDPNERHWQRDEDGMAMTARRTPRGWELVMWQNRLGVVAIFQKWLASAAGGDDVARQQLQRYLDCAVVPGDLRAKARHLLDSAAPAQ